MSGGLVQTPIAADVVAVSFTDGELAINPVTGDVSEYRSADGRFHYLGRDPRVVDFFAGLRDLDSRGESL